MLHRSVRSGARISGVGGYRPPWVVSNDEIASSADVTADWIQSRSGIRTRHRAGPEDTVAVMAAKAGCAALNAAGVAPSDVNLVLLSSTTARRPVPGSAPETAFRMGCDNAGAFDINGACAGFTYGLSIAAEMVRGGAARHVLVTAADRFVDWTSPAVPDTYAILADGGGAAIVSQSAEDGIGPCVWGSDGAKHDLIRIPHDADDVRMNGPLVYRWAVDTLPDVGRSACGLAGTSVQDLDWLVMHQANLRMVDAVAAELGIKPDGVARDVVDTGNTSSASIPLALSRLQTEGRLAAGEQVLLLGFGAGLTYAGMVARAPAGPAEGTDQWEPTIR